MRSPPFDNDRFKEAIRRLSPLNLVAVGSGAFVASGRAFDLLLKRRVRVAVGRYITVTVLRGVLVLCAEVFFRDGRDVEDATVVHAAVQSTRPFR